MGTDAGTAQPAPPQSGRLGRPPRLSKDAIVAAARRLLEQEGVDKLSMRRLAKVLDSTAMALYHHVRDKDELLLLVLEDHARRFPHRELSEEPRARLLEAAQLLHDILADCPWIVRVLAADDLMAVSALWIVESIVDAAVACGCTPEDAVHVYRVIWYYTAGELLIRDTADRRRAEREEPPVRDTVMAGLDAEQFPRLASLASAWPDLTARDTHRRGLEGIVNGLLPA
jgi:AcrR family transcriptional regulator